MKAIIFDDFGAADVLHLGEVDDPTLRDDDLLLRVHAAGVNRADIIQRTGGYKRDNFGDSPIMGLEVAGEVIAVGRNVHGHAVGDRVMGIVGGGAYAERARIDHRMAMAIPDGMDYADAAAIPEAFVTAHEAAIHLGRLESMDAILVHAGASGVGSAAIQLAHAAGARVFATASEGKLDRVRGFGADVAIDYRSSDFAEVIAHETDKRGVDVIVDFIGASYFDRNLASLNHGGRLVEVGLLGGHAKASLPLDQLLYRHLQIIGTVMKSRSAAVKQAMTRRFRERWLHRFNDGTLHPVVDSRFPLAEAAAAHAHMESGKSVGKIILTM